MDNPPITVSVPIYIRVSKKRNFALNLNEYRNAHYFILNKAKVLFSEQIAPVIAQLEPMLSCKMHFSLFFGSNREVDTANVCCIVEKFFCDALVEAGILSDDNRKIITKSSSDFGAVDTKNPRVEVTIFDYELKPKEQKPMRLILSQQEIAAVLINHFMPLLSSGEEKRGEFNLAADAEGNPVGVLDILHPASPQEKLPEAPVAPLAPVTAPKVSKPRAAAPAALPKPVTPVTLVATEEGVAAVPVETAEEGEDDRGDIFNMTPRDSAIEIENDAQDAAEAASHANQTADAGTKEVKATKPALPLVPATNKPRTEDEKAAHVAAVTGAKAPVDRRGLFPAQGAAKPAPAGGASEKPVGAVAGLFAGLAKPTHPK